MTQIFVIAFGALFLYGAGFATGWKVDSWKNDAEYARNLKVQMDNMERVREERDRIANRFEKRLANLRVTNTTINNEVRHEVEKTVYGDPNCNLPESGVRLRNAAIDAANGNPRKPDPALPAPAKDGGQTPVIR